MWNLFCFLSSEKGGSVLFEVLRNFVDEFAFRSLEELSRKAKGSNIFTPKETETFDQLVIDTLVGCLLLFGLVHVAVVLFMTDVVHVAVVVLQQVQFMLLLCFVQHVLFMLLCALYYRFWSCCCCTLCNRC